MNEVIEKLIYEIRGKQVMLDSDLARLYECKNGTKTINLAVKRNTDRFPSDFYFQLTKDEVNELWFQFETANKMTRVLPYAFTEQGVAMLSSVLHTDIAIKKSIIIMRSFVAMRKYISSNLITNKRIIIIDNYAGKELLDILKDLNNNIIIVSKNINIELVKKYKSQYNNIIFIENNSFHDRFIIIDDKVLYHCGSSFKDLGKKCFAINSVDNIDALNNILKIINV